MRSAQKNLNEQFKWSSIFLTWCHVETDTGRLTFCPGGRPGSQTASDSSFTRRSWTWPMLSPTLSRPSWSMPRVGTSTFISRPKTLPKPRRNCISIRQSETARPGRMRPGILENSGRGWQDRGRTRNLRLVFYDHLHQITSFKTTLQHVITSLIWELFLCGFGFQVKLPVILENYAVLSFSHLRAHYSIFEGAWWLTGVSPGSV